MTENFLNTVKSLLTHGQIASAVTLARTWLAAAAPGEPELLLAQCPPELKPKVVVLFRDLLSRYPYTIVGAPTTMYFHNDLESLNEIPPVVKLPFPDVFLENPAKSLTFLGWIRSDVRLPLQIPFKPDQYHVTLPPNRITAAVALFKSSPGFFDQDPPQIAAEWWAQLFEGYPGSVHLASRAIFPYPDAIEATREMLFAATGLEKDTAHHHFISDTVVAWSRAAGEHFKACCHHHHPDKGLC